MTGVLGFGRVGSGHWEGNALACEQGTRGNGTHLSSVAPAHRWVSRSWVSPCYCCVLSPVFHCFLPTGYCPLLDVDSGVDRSGLLPLAIPSDSKPAYPHKYVMAELLSRAWDRQSLPVEIPHCEDDGFTQEFEQDSTFIELI